MMWQKCKLKKKIGQEKDALGNLTGGEWKTVKTIECRFTPWTDEQVAVDERKVTENIQQFALPICYKDFPKECTHASVNDGPEQEIRQVIDLSSRWTLIQVRVSKE